MNYLEYIQKNAHRIGVERQDPFTIEGIYGNKMERIRMIDNPYFQHQVDELSGIPLTREFITKVFNQNTYTGFVATMLWGGLGMSNWNQIIKAMSIDKPEVECKINNLQFLLGADKIHEAFMSLQSCRDKTYPQTNKFAGVDISYFTKLLYFLYNGDSSVSPIIFDKWSTYIHAGILFSLNEIELLNTFYKIGYNSKRQFYISIKSNKTTGYRFSVYYDYLQRMANLSSQLNLPNPGLLEEYLFGKDLKHNKNKNDNNPRYFVSYYVKNSFNALSNQ